MKRKILQRVLLSIPLLLIIIALWVIGFKSIMTDIKVGHFPMYQLAQAYNIPEWTPLVISFVIILFLVYTFRKEMKG